MGEMIPVTIVNHVAIDIAISPDALWQAILNDYVEAKKFREMGMVEPIDDPAAVLGGYRFRSEKDSIVDERVAHITELDHEARRLSMFADYLSVPGGLQVYATYQAQEAVGGARFALDCHARLCIDAPKNVARVDLAVMVAKTTAESEAGLIIYLKSLKSKLEIVK